MTPVAVAVVLALAFPVVIPEGDLLLPSLVDVVILSAAKNPRILPGASPKRPVERQTSFHLHPRPKPPTPFAIPKMLPSPRMPLTANHDKNKLYYGDNLQVLRGKDTDNRPYIADQSVDLIYLDPPFNSRQDYNVLFAEKDDNRSASQITAFKDTWEWNLEARRSYEHMKR